MSELRGTAERFYFQKWENYEIDGGEYTDERYRGFQASQIRLHFAHQPSHESKARNEDNLTLTRLRVENRYREIDENQFIESTCAWIAKNSDSLKTLSICCRENDIADSLSSVLQTSCSITEIDLKNVAIAQLTTLESALTKLDSLKTIGIHSCVDEANTIHALRRLITSIAENPSVTSLEVT